MHPQILRKSPYHIVFGTRYRRKSIGDEFAERLYEYIGGIIRENKGHLIEIGGVADHVHILANLSPVHAVSDSIRDIKANSSKWVNGTIDVRDRFEEEYIAFLERHNITFERKWLFEGEHHA